jgi:hypothetical protein
MTDGFPFSMRSHEPRSVEIPILDIDDHRTMVRQVLRRGRQGAGEVRAAGYGAVAGDARGGGHLLHARAGDDVIERAGFALEIR